MGLFFGDEAGDSDVKFSKLTDRIGTESYCSEYGIRRCLKTMFMNELYGRLNWIEPAKGSTFGFPDVIIPNDRFGGIPVELKWCKKSYKKIEVRPAQIRYHILEAEAGRKSAFIVGRKSDKFPVNLFIFPGRLCPKYGFLPTDDEMIYFSCGCRLRDILSSDEFWRKP